MEGWYLECFIILLKAKKRSPSVTELGRYTGKSRSATYVAMCNLVRKGYLRQDAKTRRFEIAVGKDGKK